MSANNIVLWRPFGPTSSSSSLPSSNGRGGFSNLGCVNIPPMFSAVTSSNSVGSHFRSSFPHSTRGSGGLRGRRFRAPLYRTNGGGYLSHSSVPTTMRAEKSLSLLTEKFVQLLQESRDGCLDLKQVIFNSCLVLVF